MSLKKISTQQLEISMGGYSTAGNREVNQDAFAVKNVTSYNEKINKGIVATLADGVSCSTHGQQASHTSVTQFITDYYSTPDSWSVKHAANQVLSSLNAWLFKHSQQSMLRHDGFITTFSALILKSTSAYLFHVGDSRIYRYRSGKLIQLTHDHTRKTFNKNNILTRALGMDHNISIDYQKISLKKNDVFLLSTDGLHEILSLKALEKHLQLIFDRTNLEESAKSLCLEASTQKSSDNISCLLLKVTDLPDPKVNELFHHLAKLTIPPALQVGHTIDRFKINKIIHQGARSHLYAASDINTLQIFVLKMPSLNFSDDSTYLNGFYKEQWIGQKLAHPNIMRIHPRDIDSPFLYHICDQLNGITLRQWMIKNPYPNIEKVQSIINKVIIATRVFQRAGIVHQDIKPENIMIDKNEKITLIDFGTATIESQYDSTFSTMALPVGAVDYIAPELLNNHPASTLSDLFSIAVISYEMICGQLPYLPNRSQSLKKAQSTTWQYRSITLFRNDLPKQLNHVLEKATQVKPEKRYQALGEFIHALSNIDTQQITQLTLIEKNPTKFWLSIAMLFMLISFIELILLII